MRKRTAASTSCGTVDRILHRLLVLLRAVDEPDFGSDAYEAVIDLGPVEPSDLVLLDDLLGEGGVEITIEGRERRRVTRIRQTSLRGVWRVRCYGDDGTMIGNHIEVGPVPALVRRTLAETCLTASPLQERLPGGRMVQRLIDEIRGMADAFRPGDRAQAIVLSEIPLSFEGRRLLDRWLGRGLVAARVRDRENCSIQATARCHVWRVRYEGGAIGSEFDTIEIGDMPNAVRALPEDFEDSAARLAELIDAHRV